MLEKWSFLVYALLLGFAFYCSLLVINAEIPFDALNHLSTHLRRLADGLVFALPAVFMRRRWSVGLWVAVVVSFILSQLWYLRNYGTLMPWSSYLMFDNLDGLGPSIVNSMRLRDLWVILPPLLWFVVYCLRYSERFKAGLWRRFAGAGIILLGVAGVLSPSYLIYDIEEYSHPCSLFRYEMLRAYRQYGFVNYTLYQIVYSRGLSDRERAEARLWLDNYHRQPVVDNIPGVTPGRNLIIILAESLQSWPVGLRVGGVEVTPRLNALIGRDSTLYWSQVLPQVKGGRSADAQLLINTGMLPINEGAAASLFGTNNYSSLPKALGAAGYETAQLLCDNRTYWNQEATTRSYGYNLLYDKLDDRVKDHRQDEHLFRNALPLLKKLRQPFMAQLVTMSGHDMVPTDMSNPFKGAEFPSKEVEYNLVITHYVDSCIGNFIDRLADARVLEKSVVVITGDHDFVTRNRYENRERVRPDDRYVPFIILNSPVVPAAYTGVIGQVDIYPTLLDVMGVSGYHWRGFGHSALRPGHPGGAVGHDGSVAGQPFAPDSLKRMWTISDLLIRGRFPLN